jgi:putative transposase
MDLTHYQSISGCCKSGGLKLDRAKRLKELERENVKLKRLVAELSLEKQILKDVAGGNF